MEDFKVHASLVLVIHAIEFGTIMEFFFVGRMRGQVIPLLCRKGFFMSS